MVIPVKDQYFGDINDYRKYGLLRAVIGAAGFRVLIAWMLTPDDGSTDGGLISYLEHPDRWSRHDPKLFHQIKSLLSRGKKRRVKWIEGLGLLPEAGYFPARVPDEAPGRDRWFRALVEKARGHDMVFLDPDNGLEVGSKPYGRKGSSKYLYWHEVRTLWRAGKSLLIFQHFTRENRMKFIPRMRDALRDAAPGSLVTAFSTARVVFLLALQPDHRGKREAVLRSIAERWEGQIRRFD
jgi:hypothetical protein